MTRDDSTLADEGLLARTHYIVSCSETLRICKPRATRVQKAAASNATAYHLPSGPSRLVAHTGLKAISRLAPSALLGRFDWLYGEDVTKSNL